MSLKGHFEKYISPRAGGLSLYRFIITCDNLFQSETFDAAIMPANQSAQPLIFRQLSLKAGKSYSFDYDTVDWQWCDGDSFALLDKKNQIKKQWVLNAHAYAQGECPVCHGSHKCLACSGKGFKYVGKNIERCNACAGTGFCQTCYVPQRQVAQGAQQPSATSDARRRHCEQLRQSILELQSKIERTEFDMRMMQLKNMDVANRSVYLSYSQLITQYRLQLNQLQSQLSQLENL